MGKDIKDCKHKKKMMIIIKNYLFLVKNKEKED